MFTGVYAINPFNGEKVPVWVTNYVLFEYGTGAVMGVPTHDERDFMFAKKYNLPMKIVIQNKEHNLTLETMENAYVEDGELVESGQFTGMNNRKAITAMIDWLEENNLGKRRVNYRLRDWLISRQRYWGAPIPIIYCPHCGEVLVPEEQLPVKLPKDVKFETGATSPLAQAEDFVNCTCPNVVHLQNVKQILWIHSSALPGTICAMLTHIMIKLHLAKMLSIIGSLLTNISVVLNMLSCIYYIPVSSQKY